ncbi:sensor histidine kinase [Haoranjiania flava]|uniref:histidine kinase n=1 Tax=Haoranjiania flava TaxID=1856322 RepID=A0AAE3IJY4_9BACT|nr:ATP-binding protein [Haoranjiania flava]MCU7693153.1 ATP-binding protein [Haoranjiania flava]
MFDVVKKHKLSILTAIYWTWMLYIVAALVWWFISLERQNHQMYQYRIEELIKDDPLYTDKVYALDDARRRKSFQYIGEGVVSLALIIIGAGYLYRATRKQFRFATQQQNFMMAITHELKTPIAVAQLNLETLQKRKLNEEMQQKLIANTLIETSRLNTLTNNVLFSSQLESGQYSVQYQPVDISKIVLEAVKDFRRRFIQRQIEHVVEENLFITGEHLLLQLVISNLIDNAIKYSPADSLISVRLKQKENCAVLSIADEGEGIREEEKNKIFNKFYRVGNEAVRKTKGTGLGLYLCKKIVKDFGGNIRIEDNKPKGSFFIINFPLIKNQNQ